MPNSSKKSAGANTTSSRKATSTTEDAGQAEVQERMDEATEQGFIGAKVDPTPNENYTVEGVTGGAPTPETDVQAAREAREATGGGLTAMEFQQRENAALEGKSEE